MPAKPSSRPGRRLIQAVVAAIIAVGAALAFAAPVQASTGTITTTRDNEAWFWQSNQDVRGCTPDTPVPIPNFTGLCPSANLSAAGPVSPGHLGVSWKLGSVDMDAYMSFDLSFLPTGSTVNSMVVTLTVSQADAADTKHTQEHQSDPNGAASSQPKAPATSNASAAKIKACFVNGTWSATFGAPPADRNPDNPTQTNPTDPYLLKTISDQCVEGKPGAKAWTFDITPFAQKWVAGTTNNGFALLPEGGPTDNWVVEFHGAFYDQATTDPTTGGEGPQQVLVDHSIEAKAAMNYVAAVPPPPPPPPPPTSTGGGGGTTAPPPAPTDTSSPAPEPSTSPSLQPLAPVGQSKPQTPWYEWMMLPLGALGFVALSRAIGREAGTVGVNNVAEVLRRRRSSPGD